MVKKSKFSRQYHTVVAHQSHSMFVKFLMSPVVLSLLSLTATFDYAIARTNPDLVVPNWSLPTQAKDLVVQLPTGAKTTPATTPKPSAPPALTRVISYGNKISLNGRTLSGAWLQQRNSSGQITTHLSDGVAKQLIGVDLLDSSNYTRQPIQWYSSTTKPTILTSILVGGYRYLDFSHFATTYGWQMQVQGNTLIISTPNAKITEINQGKESFGERIIVSLNRPAPWQITQHLPVKKNEPLPDDPSQPALKPSSPTTREWTITLDSIADPLLTQRYTPPVENLPTPLTPLQNNLKQMAQQNGQENTSPTLPSLEPPAPQIKQVEVVNNQTIIRLEIPLGLAPLISTLPNPNRLLIDIRPDAMVQRSITWTPGLQWRQQFVNLGQERFPVVWLEINPRTTDLKIRPIVTNSNTLTGTAPLIQTAQQYLAVAAINGGYFNRNNRLPLGAIRRDDQWLSSPILNRGAIAWNDSGQFYLGRLVLLENLIVTSANNLKLPILALNSGYVQSGIARYTPTWGSSYTSLTDNEIILVVQKNQVINQLPAGKAGETAIPIPQDGYLLTLRGNATNNTSVLPVGSSLSIESSTYPTEFSRYPQILGAGPLLLQNRQIVLDGKGEKFSNAFVAQKAVRSAICTTATGNLIIAAVHNRAGGSGPTLTEHAQLMQKMGCVDALNLDGGSSTSLYLGGQLLDRSPNTAARVHNGIGIFLQPRR